MAQRIWQCLACGVQCDVLAQSAAAVAAIFSLCRAVPWTDCAENWCLVANNLITVICVLVSTFANYYEN